MVKRRPRNLFNKIYSKVPRLCVDLIIKNKKRFVFTKRDILPCKGMWHIPGGTILLGENIAQGIKRIAKYETGLNVRIEKFLCILEYPKNISGKVISLVYLLKPNGGKLRGSKDGMNIDFFKRILEKIIKFQKDFLYKYLKLR